MNPKPAAWPAIVDELRRAETAVRRLAFRSTDRRALYVADTLATMATIAEGASGAVSR